ncbi:selenocysteine-specific translation elongation factor [Brevibacillus ginsengisoli]|uniref:selenocysteine-specific translation elongation factor n=1 Tax=Brevibacillus ginsengisoli TaxID=363854 RepID=UPI003CFA6EAF
MKHYTIGIAGHIDHGKTSLTKALTGVDTDRLKEEKERQISIELGFAPLTLSRPDMQVSVIDVPGHKRFIRQMIAGVAGIDLILLVVAADEGVMPQTKEHLEIVKLLGIKKGIVVISKIDRVDTEMLELAYEDIHSELEGTVFYNAPTVYVNNLQKTGIVELKQAIEQQLDQTVPRNEYGAFRMPIDQVFTVKGHGTVVRGTVYEGEIRQGDDLLILPEGIPTKARQLQVHGKQVVASGAGQRLAINLSNVDKDQLRRGQALVSTADYKVTQVMDVSLHCLNVGYPIKQRMPVKCHLGTSEVMGHLVFFDRQKVEQEEENILCQLRLTEPVVARRGDRFIIRRSSPVETIGGGWVIDVFAQKHRFGPKTMELLQNKQSGTPLERILRLLEEQKLMTKNDIQFCTSLSEEQFAATLQSGHLLSVDKQKFTSQEVVAEVIARTERNLREHHEHHPMLIGLGKAEYMERFSQAYPRQLLEYALTHNDVYAIRQEQYIACTAFHPHMPKQWEVRMQRLFSAMEQGGIKVKPWQEYVDEFGLPEAVAQAYRQYLLDNGLAYVFDPIHLIAQSSVRQAIALLQKQTGQQFELGVVKDLFGITRKHLVPFVELLDKLQVTERTDNGRRWK